MDCALRRSVFLCVLIGTVAFIATSSLKDYADLCFSKRESSNVIKDGNPQLHQLVSTPPTFETPPSPSAKSLLDLKFPSHNKDGPKVVWIMSFGGSGTSYTITNTEIATGVTTASNYAEEFSELVPLQPRGPYLHHPAKAVPPLVLTKTHCGGYCIRCPAKKYVHTVESFDEACRTSKITVTQNGTESSRIKVQVYDAAILAKAVHLLRNPFDNLVGRFHLSQKRQGTSYSNDGKGLMEWCRDFDDHASRDELESGHIPSEFESIPCHGEWFRYIQWHNLAHEVTEKHDIPVHVLHYEDYTINYEQTVKQLYAFLEQEPKRPFKQFVPGKSYESFFSDVYRLQALAMTRAMTSPTVWSMLERYF